MAKFIKVLTIRVFGGKKYLLNLDKDYEQTLINLLKGLFEKAPMGPIAHISLGRMDEDKYLKVNPSPDLMVGKGETNEEEKDSE